MRRSETETRPRVGRWWLCFALLVTACSTIREAPQTGTETGNPPVIQADLVTLAVSSDELHLIGQPGAVPAGARVEATSTQTGAVFHATAKADGSFDIKLDASKTDSFQLRALQGSRSSSNVYVTRGGASVGEDAGQALSCGQRGDMARSQMGTLAASADRACTTDDDCMLVSTGTACSDSCTDSVLSAAGAAQVTAEREAIESGLCKDFSSDGCSRLLLPCVPPLSTDPYCKNGSCELRDPTQVADDAGPALSCAQRGDMASSQMGTLVASADRTCTSDDDCMLVSTSTVCSFACFESVLSAAGAAQVATERQSIESDLCKDFSSDGCSRLIPPCALQLATEPFCSSGSCQLREPT